MATFNYADIPAGVQTVIKNLQEIVGGDISDGEVYAVLRECGMDPNAAVEQLLAQDPFQEVKSKKGKKKEKLMEARSRAAGSRAGSKARIATYARASVSNDAGVKNNDTDQAMGKKDSNEASECPFPSDSVLLPSEGTQVPEKFDAIKQQVSSRGNSNSSIAFPAESVDSGDLPHPTTNVPRVRVIFPSHFHVPESVRLGLTFGSFGDDFRPSSVLGIERSPVQHSDSHQVAAGHMDYDSRTVHESWEKSESQEEDASSTPNLSGVSSVLSTLAPPMTQSVGLMQSSIHVTQQLVHIFRTSTGVHVSHFPVNYVDYGHDMTPGQQNQSSVRWVPAREFATMPSASFYSMSVHGQHVQLMPPQTNLYHPSQTMTTSACQSEMDMEGGVGGDGQNNSPDGHQG